MYERKIICLANSRKRPSGRCIAGKEYEGERKGMWIRPISSRPGHEVSEEERRYEDGTRTQLLDIVTVPLERYVPVGHQTENNVLADDYYWRKEGDATWEQIYDMIDVYDPDFWEESESTYNGLNDKISEDDLTGIQSSLKLIHVPEIELVVRLEPGYEGLPGRRRVRARFEYNNGEYLLSVTDPEIEQVYLAMNNGTYNVENVILCISIGELWNNYAFRLVASIITEDRFGD